MPSQRKPSQSVFNLRAALGVGNKTQTGGRGNGAAALRIQKYNNRTDRDNVDRIKKKKNEKYTSSKVRASVRSANAPKPTESGSKGIRQTLVCASCLRGPSGPSDPFCNVRQVVFVRWARTFRHCISYISAGGLRKVLFCYFHRGMILLVGFNYLNRHPQ